MSGRTKTESFSREDQILSRTARALAHPARIAILRVLASRQSCVCGDIVSELPLAQSTVSQHLRELKEAGLIRGETEGPSVCYCLDQENLRRLFGEIKNLLSSLESCCAGGECR